MAMEIQLDLGGIPTMENDQNDEKGPWTGICCQACWTAKYQRCTCKCGGVHHGKGSGKLLKGKALTDQGHFLSAEAAQIYARLIKDWKCTGCERNLQGEPILHYNHDEGFPVEGFERNQWLFITCPVCAYQNSLIKMGVPSDATIEYAKAAKPVEPLRDQEGEQ
jgi:hypothetical protein